MTAYATEEELVQWMRLVEDVELDPEEISARDTTLTLALNSATRTLNELCRRTFTTHDGISRVYYTSRYVRQRRIRVDDIRSVTSITAGDTALENNDWILPEPPLQSIGEPVNYIYRETFWPLASKIVVTGNFGWAEVPSDIHLATLRLAAEYYKRDSESDEVGADGITLIRKLAQSPMLRALWKPYQLVAVA